MSNDFNLLLLCTKQTIISHEHRVFIKALGGCLHHLHGHGGLHHELLLGDATLDHVLLGQQHPGAIHELQHPPSGKRICFEMLWLLTNLNIT